MAPFPERPAAALPLTRRSIPIMPCWNLTCSRYTARYTPMRWSCPRHSRRWRLCPSVSWRPCSRQCTTTIRSCSGWRRDIPVNICAAAAVWRLPWNTIAPRTRWRRQGRPLKGLPEPSCPRPRALGAM